MKTVRDTLVRLYKDEQGAEGLEKLLIVAAIVLPLLAVLIIFRDWIHEWVVGEWQDVQGDSDNFTPGTP